MKKLILIFFLLITVNLNGCVNSNKIDVVDDSFTYLGSNYTPSSSNNFFLKTDNFNNKIGWTYNFYHNKVDIYVSETDADINFIYIPGFNDEFWVKDEFSFFDVNDYKISKILIWEPNTDTFDIQENTIYNSFYGSDLYFSDLISSSLSVVQNYEYLCNLKIEFEHISDIYFGGVYLASNENSIIIVGLKELYEYDSYVISSTFYDLLI